MLARNIPLVVLLALLGMLFWPTEPPRGAAADEPTPIVRKPNGMHPPTGPPTATTACSATAA